jgi:hypothetical protein
MKSCSPLHPVNVGLLLLGAGAIGMAARGRGARNAQPPDLSLARLRDGQAVDAERDYRANGVTFSSDSGAGATPNNENVKYLGFVVWMRPSEFLSLNPPLPQTQAQRGKITAWNKSLAQGVTLGPPMLYVDLEDDAMDDGENVLNGHFVVRNHEGRHRMTATLQRSDEPVPVHVFPGHQLRARHFHRFDFGSATFRPRSMASSVRVRPSAWALDGVVHKISGSRALGQQGISLGNLREQAQHQHKTQKAAQTQQTRRRPRFRHTDPKTPSVQALTQRLKIPSDKAQALHDLMQQGQIRAALQAAKTAMDAYDVKVIRGKTEVPLHFTGLEYVDTADAWSDTLIYDYGRNQFLIAPWGDTVDANKDRF